jgi:hypothetical protein
VNALAKKKRRLQAIKREQVNSPYAALARQCLAAAARLGLFMVAEAESLGTWRFWDKATGLRLGTFEVKPKRLRMGVVTRHVSGWCDALGLLNKWRNSDTFREDDTENLPPLVRRRLTR